MTNIVFWTDLALGTNPEREAERRAIAQEAEKAEKEAQMTRLRETTQPKRGARLTSAAPAAVATEPRVKTAPVEKKVVMGRARHARAVSPTAQTVETAQTTQERVARR